MAMPMEVGHVHLQTSCSVRAAADIDRGVSLLYSFWYDAARRSFQNAEAEQPELVGARQPHGRGFERRARRRTSRLLQSSSIRRRSLILRPG